MAKALFRYLRGEINGFYLTSLHNSLNTFTQNVKDFLISYRKMQFNTQTMDAQTIYNLGKFASIFTPRTPRSEASTSVYLTDSAVVGGVEFSERGLYDTENERFDFEHTDESITSPDINTLATTTKRSSLVGTESVAGYIAESETDVLSDSGSVRINKVMSEPPEQEGYSDFFGNKFLFLSEGEMTYENVSARVFYELFKAEQWIRYNGCSLKSLVRLIEILCPNGLVRIQAVTIADTKDHYNIFYIYDDSVEVQDKVQRASLLSYVVNLKFKQYNLIAVQ